MIVLKFGGASVASPEHIKHIAGLIARHRLEGEKVVVVVSAMGNTTNQLITLAQEIHPNPPKREYDMLVSVGERISMALLAMALELHAIDAVSFTGSQCGILTCESHSNAKIVDIRPKRILKALEEGRVVIVAGFQGMSHKGEITTLGRGGSDTTAVALAAALNVSKVIFYKDVPGVFSADPKVSNEAEFYPRVSYDRMYQLADHGAKILHPRAVMLAKKNAIRLEVKSYQLPQEYSGTLIEDSEIPQPLQPVYE
jgi:aspartate kinase